MQIIYEVQGLNFNGLEVCMLRPVLQMKKVLNLLIISFWL